MTASTVAEAPRLRAAKSDIRKVKPNEMFIDMAYQRLLNEKRVRAYSDQFDPNAIGVLCLSRRGDGGYAVVDGQHRRAVLINVGESDSPVECEVFFDLSIPEEAALFRDRNQMERPSLLDRFRARLVAGDQTALDIMVILERNGWKLASTSGSGNGYFSAVGKLEKLFRANPLAAERTISTLTRSWGHDTNASDGRLVEGMGHVFSRFGDQVFIDDLVDKLAKFPGGPATFIGQARGLQTLIGGTVSRAVGEKIITTYNVRRKKSALPSLKTRVEPVDGDAGDEQE
jgi:hypothetical protein